MANEQKPQHAEAEVIAKLALEGRSAELIGLADGISVLAVPTNLGGMNITGIKPFLDAYADKPDRIAGTSRLFDVDSFCRYVNRHKNNDSAVFLDPARNAPSLTAVIDYHRRLPSDDPNKDNARFGKHRAHYAFPISDEWTSWTAQNEKEMSQETFAAWIEDNIVDVLDPENTEADIKGIATKMRLKLADGSTLISLSRGLSVYAGYQMTKAVNLKSGEVQMNFTEEHKDASGAQLDIPGAFAIAIPVFRSGIRHQLAVRLRYRVVPGQAKVLWKFEVYGADRVFDHAIAESLAEVRDETGLDAFVGTPEV